MRFNRTRARTGSAQPHTFLLEKKSARLCGRFAFLTWLVVHLAYLAGFRNRVSVLLEWAYAYFTYRPGARLISADDKQYRAFLAQIMLGKENQRAIRPPRARDLFGGEAELALRDWLAQRYRLSERRIVEYLEHRGRSSGPRPGDPPAGPAEPVRCRRPRCTRRRRHRRLGRCLPRHT